MTDDKFILMGLNDERSSHVAEVLKNKTAKKILDFFGDIREASEKDISDKLNMPINTVEYNLKKLLKSGLVEKTKNFFWSVKGKKIPMYKLAKKHIIISPSKKPSLSYIKSLLPVFIIAIALVALVAVSMLQEEPIVDQTQLKQFDSQSELNAFIKDNVEGSGFFGRFGKAIGGEIAMAETTAAGSADSASDYSETNIQVQGVDEADIVKNDGKYIYVVSGNRVVIVDAYPAENMEILSEIDVSGVNQIFINDNKLIVFANNNVYIYDVSDKENPELESEIESDGNYVDSRMIGDYVYVISNKYVNRDNPYPPIYKINGLEEKVSATEVSYWPYPDTSYVFTSILAINVEDGEFDSNVYLTGASRNIYVSQNNIYLTYQKTVNREEYAEDIADQVYFPLLSSEYDDKIQNVLDSNDNSWQKLNKMQEIVDEYAKALPADEFEEFSEELLERLEEFEVYIQKKQEKTIIHKININEGEIEYLGVGEVPGNVLNQFSMDEYDGYFRIATTTGRWGYTSLNHIYILDEDLEIVGSVEDLAEGERIFSARFLGKRAYLVTFEAIDPLFVIDLSDPENPEVLGYLKIPGYSDYLHPYDENHVIGIGKDVDASIDADKIHSDYAVYYTAILGVKVSLFDVSDVSNPIEKDKIIIGDRGTESPLLNDHKALLFDKEKELLVLPISVVERENNDEVISRWQGAYVLNFNLDEISERGRITHNNGTVEKSEYGYFDYNKQIKRSLYMDDVLYTISNTEIRAHDLDSLDYLNWVEWEQDDYRSYPEPRF